MSVNVLAAHSARRRTTANQPEHSTVEYMLIIYGNEGEYQRMSQAQMGERMAAYRGFIEALNKAGVYKASGRLQTSSNAATVRVVNGKAQVLNGPYADSREQLGGYVLIDVPDFDAAIAWAARCPGATHGTMEVRPIWQMPPNT